MNKKICISNSNGDRVIDIDDILYFESISGMINVHCKKGEEEVMYRFPGTLKEIEIRLSGNGFIRIHKSFIVPKARVTGIEREWVTLRGINDIRLPIGRVYADRLTDMIRKNSSEIIVL